MAQFLNAIFLLCAICFFQLPNIFCANVSLQNQNNSTSSANATVTCGSLNCPSETTKCVLKTVTIQNNTMIETTEQCFNSKDAVILTNSTSTKNPNPTDSVNLYSETVFGGLNSTQAHQVLNELQQFQNNMTNQVFNQVQQIQTTVWDDFQHFFQPLWSFF